MRPPFEALSERASAAAGRSRGRAVSRVAIVPILLAVATLAACIPPPAPSPPGFGPGVTPNVVVYGDSLVVESSVAIRERIGAALPGWTVTVRAFGGTAQCDWHSRMLADRDDVRPAIVVVAFSGNQLTPCTLVRPWPDFYGEDARWAQQLWAPAGSATELITIGAPPTVGQATNPVAEQYATAAAATSRSTHRDTSRVFVDPDTGLAEHVLGCAPGLDPQCDAGATRVRHYDGAHLCPDAAVTACDPTRSGVARYASEIASAVAARAGRSAPAFPDAVAAPAPVDAD